MYIWHFLKVMLYLSGNELVSLSYNLFIYNWCRICLSTLNITHICETSCQYFPDPKLRVFKNNIYITISRYLHTYLQIFLVKQVSKKSYSFYNGMSLWYVDWFSVLDRAANLHTFCIVHSCRWIYWTLCGLMEFLIFKVTMVNSKYIHLLKVFFWHFHTLLLFILFYRVIYWLKSIFIKQTKYTVSSDYLRMYILMMNSIKNDPYPYLLSQMFLIKIKCES